MPIYLDLHEMPDGVTAEHVAANASGRFKNRT
jgi:hypothetical protein